MYGMNNACNVVLSRVDGIPFTGDAATRVNTIKAWCYWWKGYAYASIGLMYYSALINDDPAKPSSDYVLHDAIIGKSTDYFNLAAATLGTIISTSDYQDVLGKLIPSFCQVGNGGGLSTHMLIKDM